MVLSFSVFPRKLTREALFMVLLRIWLPQMMKRLLRKPRRQKGIRGRKTAFDNVWPLSVASCDKFCISIDCIHWPNSCLQVTVARSQFENKYFTFSLYLWILWSGTISTTHQSSPQESYGAETHSRKLKKTEAQNLTMWSFLIYGTANGTFWSNLG